MRAPQLTLLPLLFLLATQPTPTFAELGYVPSALKSVRGGKPKRHRPLNSLSIQKAAVTANKWAKSSVAPNWDMCQLVWFTDDNLDMDPIGHKICSQGKTLDLRPVIKEKYQVLRTFEEESVDDSYNLVYVKNPKITPSDTGTPWSRLFHAPEFEDLGMNLVMCCPDSSSAGLDASRKYMNGYDDTKIKAKIKELLPALNTAPLPLDKLGCPIGLPKGDLCLFHLTNAFKAEEMDLGKFLQHPKFQNTWNRYSGGVYMGINPVVAISELVAHVGVSATLTWRMVRMILKQPRVLDLRTGSPKDWNTLSKERNAEVAGAVAKFKNDNTGGGEPGWDEHGWKPVPCDTTKYPCKPESVPEAGCMEKADAISYVENFYVEKLWMERIPSVVDAKQNQACPLTYMNEENRELSREVKGKIGDRKDKTFCCPKEHLHIDADVKYSATKAFKGEALEINKNTIRYTSTQTLNSKSSHSLITGSSTDAFAAFNFFGDCPDKVTQWCKKHGGSDVNTASALSGGWRLPWIKPENQDTNDNCKTLPVHDYCQQCKKCEDSYAQLLPNDGIKGITYRLATTDGICDMVRGGFSKNDGRISEGMGSASVKALKMCHEWRKANGPEKRYSREEIEAIKMARL